MYLMSTLPVYFPHLISQARLSEGRVLSKASPNWVLPLSCRNRQDFSSWPAAVVYGFTIVLDVSVIVIEYNKIKSPSGVEYNKACLNITSYEAFVANDSLSRNECNDIG